MVFECSEPRSAQWKPSTVVPYVSVIVPIYNGAADVPDLLNCLYTQTYPVDRIEYLLVDNNSSDRTVELLYCQIANSPRANFRVLRETQIQSSYAARNAGILQAKGEILAFTDADCRPEAEWIEQLVKPFSHSAIGLVAGEILALPGNSLLERYAERHQTLSQRHTLAHPFSPYGQTANLAIRCSAVRQVGLFRPYLTTGGDADLCWRILGQGYWQIQLAEQAIVRHRHRSTLSELRSQWRRYGQSNRYLHELHGISLTKPLSWQDSLYRWSRWLLKEVPLTMFAALNPDCNGSVQHPDQNPSTWLDQLIDTPLDLICRQARSQGQCQAQLPDLARQVAWHPSPHPEQEFKAAEIELGQDKAKGSEID